MMEKYGVEEASQTYEVVLPKPGKPDDFQVIGNQLSLPEAQEIQNQQPSAIIRPEK